MLTLKPYAIILQLFTVCSLKSRIYSSLCPQCLQWLEHGTSSKNTCYINEYSITFLNHKVAAIFILYLVYTYSWTCSQSFLANILEYIYCCKNITHIISNSTRVYVLFFLLVFFLITSQSSTLHPLIIWGDITITYFVTPHFTISTPSSTIPMGDICLKSFSS